jgi:hypothetical protein
VYNCDRCKSRKLQKQNGCKRVFKRKSIREIECNCGGDKDCEICKGENCFEIHTCPRNILNDPATNRILPYFYDYISKGLNYPCGNRYNSPMILIQAFDVLLSVYDDERKKAKSREGKGKE